MAKFTPNYQLHQWEPTDDFLRTDFNEDFAKIEAGLLDACGRTAETGGWLEDALARMGYEALQTRIAAEAKGETFPAGRALLFDSLCTTDRVALTGGFGPKTGGGVLLDTGTGLVTFEDHFGTEEYRTITLAGETVWTTKTFTAAGNGALKAIALNLLTYVSGTTAELAVLEGEKRLWSGSQAITHTTTAGTYTYAPNLTLKKGLVYTLRLTLSGHTTHMYYSAGGSTFGYQAVCTPAAGSTGTITAAAQTVDAFRAARAWVRHSGGTVSCALQRGSGAYLALTKTGSRTTVDCRGTACTETEFKLPASTALGGSTRLRVTVQNSTDVTIYDYGVVLI